MLRFTLRAWSRGPFEERDLLRNFGWRYAEYRKQVPMFIPRPKPIERLDEEGETVGSRG